MKEDVNGLKDERDRVEAKPGGGSVKIRPCGDEDWVGGVVVVVVVCSCERDAVEGAADTVF